MLLNVPLADEFLIRHVLTTLQKAHASWQFAYPVVTNHFLTHPWSWATAKLMLQNEDSARRESYQTGVSVLVPLGYQHKHRATAAGVTADNAGPASAPRAAAAPLLPPPAASPADGSVAAAQGSRSSSYAPPHKRRPDFSSYRCNSCGLLGHIARNCPTVKYTGAGSGESGGGPATGANRVPMGSQTSGQAGGQAAAPAPAPAAPAPSP